MLLNTEKTRAPVRKRRKKPAGHLDRRTLALDRRNFRTVSEVPSIQAGSGAYRALISSGYYAPSGQRRNCARPVPPTKRLNTAGMEARSGRIFTALLLRPYLSAPTALEGASHDALEFARIYARFGRIFPAVILRLYLSANTALEGASHDALEFARIYARFGRIFPAVRLRQYLRAPNPLEGAPQKGGP